MTKTILRIGRDPSCEIPIADDSISRFHAEIELTDDGRLFIVDCNSSNGTFVIRSGVKEKITQATASATESVSFGNCCFQVSDLINDVRSRSPQRLPEQSPASLDPNAKRIRCSVCGFVKYEGESCPRCASLTKRIS